MGLTLFPLGDYCALLDKLGLLAAPLPEGLELGRTVELLSYNSRGSDDFKIKLERICIYKRMALLNGTLESQPCN